MPPVALSDTEPVGFRKKIAVSVIQLIERVQKDPVFGFRFSNLVSKANDIPFILLMKGTHG